MEAEVKNSRCDVAILGGGITGMLAAIYLKQRFPDLEIVVFDKPGAKPPVVGESLTEASTLFLYELGFANSLEENHLPKHGLTYYFKRDLNDPTDRTYAVHGTDRLLPIPSHQLNRFTFETELAEKASSLGLEVRQFKGTDVDIRQGDCHQIVGKDVDGKQSVVSARWVIDATGRSGILAKKLGIRRRKEEQRSSFWFRLKDFDPDKIDDIDALQSGTSAFPHRLATHHFFGTHCWNWLIPLRDPETNMMSIGSVYRPDMRDTEIRSIEDFLDYADKEHPVLAELVRSGTVVDTNLYRNYMYDATQVYSEDGWFVVGDAANSVDPLYSLGLALTSVQIKQVGAIVEKDMAGELTADYVETLDICHRRVFAMVQNNISSFYNHMHDPLHGHLQVHFDTAAYFFFLLPHWMKGYATDANGARWLRFCIAIGESHIRSLHDLFAAASKKHGAIEIERDLSNLYEVASNWELGRFSESDLQRYLSTLAIFAGRMRLRYLVTARGFRWWYHLPVGLAAILFGAVTRFLPAGRKITRARRAITGFLTAPLRLLKRNKPREVTRELKGSEPAIQAHTVP